MIKHNDDAFVTMLLMVQINPQRDELVLPLTAPEWHHWYERVRNSRYGQLGNLLNADMSEVMMLLNCTEDEAYRLCVLLGRMLPLSIFFDQMCAREIDMMTYEEQPYPQKLRDQLSDKAPPLLYLRGRHEMFRQPAVAVLGGNAPRPDAAAEIKLLARQAAEAGYVIIADGRNGAGIVAAHEAVSHGGFAALVLAGDFNEYVQRPEIEALLADRRISIITPIHPGAPYTSSHANQRNKLIYALSDAAFVFSCEEGKGTTWAGAVEALRGKYCSFIYALDTDQHSGNRPLIQRGAMRMPRLDEMGIKTLSEFWQSAAAEQLCMFD